MKSLKHTIFLAAFIGLASCASIEVPATNPLKPSTDWVANSPEWAAEAEAVYAEATDYVTLYSEGREKGSWAVVLDVDETVLNNVEYQIRLDQAGESYSGESWYAWTQEASAPLVPGVEDFIETVNALGGHVALVTNRRDDEQFATEKNLADVGLARHDDFRILLTRAKPNGKSHKQSRFDLVPAMLAVQGYPDVEIIAFVGDNVGDKPETKGEWRFFCIDQGAMYGEPCAATPGPGR